MASSLAAHRGRRALLGVLVEHVPWALPMLGVALFVNNSIRSSNGRPVDAQAKARNRAKLPKLKRLGADPSAQQSAPEIAKEVALVEDEGEEADEERSETSLLLDAVQMPAALMEWFQEDEVEAMHQAKAGQAQLLQMLQQHGMRMLLDDAAYSECSEASDSLDGFSQLPAPLSTSANARSRFAQPDRASQHQAAAAAASGAGVQPAAAQHAHGAAAEPGSLGYGQAGYYIDSEGDGDDEDFLGSEWDTDSPGSYGWSQHYDLPSRPQLQRMEGQPLAAGGAFSGDGLTALGASAANGAASSSHGSTHSGTNSASDSGGGDGGHYIRDRRRLPGDADDGAGPWGGGGGGGYYMQYAPSPPDCDPLDFMPDFEPEFDADFGPDFGSEYDPDFDIEDTFEAYGRALSLGAMAGEMPMLSTARDGGDGLMNRERVGLLDGPGGGGQEGEDREELDRMLHALIARARQGHRQDGRDAGAASE